MVSVSFPNWKWLLHLVPNWENFNSDCLFFFGSELRWGRGMVDFHKKFLFRIRSTMSSLFQLLPWSNEVNVNFENSLLPWSLLLSQARLSCLIGRLNLGSQKVERVNTRKFLELLVWISEMFVLPLALKAQAVARTTPSLNWIRCWLGMVDFHKKFLFRIRSTMSSLFQLLPWSDEVNVNFENSLLPWSLLLSQARLSCLIGRLNLGSQKVERVNTRKFLELLVWISEMFVLPSGLEGSSSCPNHTLPKLDSVLAWNGWLSQEISFSNSLYHELFVSASSMKRWS